MNKNKLIGAVLLGVLILALIAISYLYRRNEPRPAGEISSDAAGRKMIPAPINNPIGQPDPSVVRPKSPEEA